MAQTDKESGDGDRGAQDLRPDTQDLLAALGHPLRTEILKLFLRQGDDSLSPSDASRRLSESLSKVSYHFRALANRGVIDLVDSRQVRGSVQHFYVARPVVGATNWVRENLGVGPNRP